MSRLEIWAATPAPFDAQGQADVSVIAAQAAHLASTGVHGAFVNGTTGEFPALSTAERMAIPDAWARARPDGFGLALHVGGTDPAQVRQLAAQAESLRVDYIAAVAPYYGQAPTVELAFDVHRPFREIADLAGRHGGLGFIKELLNELGPDAGRPRTPWGPLADADRAAAAELATRLRSHELLPSRTGAGHGSR